MPSFDDRSHSSFSPLSGPGQSAPLMELSPAEENPTTPLSLPSGDISHQPTSAAGLLPALPVQWSPTSTGPLSSSPGVTRMLTGTLPSDPQTTGLRTPVVIKGTGKKAVAASRIPHKKRRLLVSIVGIFLLFAISGGMLFAVTPLGRDAGLSFNPMQFGSNLFSNHTSSANDLVVQATATAVYHQQNDGYVPPSGGVTSGVGSLSWPLGQCTYWSNLRYHQLTGFWVSWHGNADQWVAGARAAGWNVSQSPHVPSIIVMMPYVQGASGYGHVAVVENIVANSNPTTVHTSNMNWYANGGGWDKVSYVDFTVGSGIYFVWHS
ncbi:MAG TPA: CHAP domain-containing protein [Ktedonobacteraceae bacterium]|nr:CHAP domain-containing protein [Ktedonobacteraceae bacterium]